jgi:hypothetical protein
MAAAVARRNRDPAAERRGSVRSRTLRGVDRPLRGCRPTDRRRAPSVSSTVVQRHDDPIHAAGFVDRAFDERASRNLNSLKSAKER